jgi:hypothetical protein
MEMKSQLLIGGGSLIGLVGLYFAWNFYIGNKDGNVTLEVEEKEPEKDVDKE